MFKNYHNKILYTFCSRFLPKSKIMAKHINAWSGVYVLYFLYSPTTTKLHILTVLCAPTTFPTSDIVNLNFLSGAMLGIGTFEALQLTHLLTICQEVQIIIRINWGASFDITVDTGHFIPKPPSMQDMKLSRNPL